MFSDYVYCILVAVLLANCLVKSTSQIYWHLADPPVTFGADVQLVCNTTCCIHDSEEAVTSWAVFNEDFSSLSRNMISTNFSKYEIFTSRYECRLTIKNFEPNDINKIYTCYSQFQQYSKILTLNPGNFEQQPSANSILTWKNITDNELHVSFLIKKVYPEPRCFAYYKEINITSEMKIESKKDGMLYNTKIDINYRLLPGEFKVICVIGTKTHQLHQIQFYGIHDECSTRFQTSSLYITNIIWIILFLIPCIYLIYDKIRSKNAKAASKKDNKVKYSKVPTSFGLDDRTSLKDFGSEQFVNKNITSIQNSVLETNNVVETVAEISNMEYEKCPGSNAKKNNIWLSGRRDFHIENEKNNTLNSGSEHDTFHDSNNSLSERKMKNNGNEHIEIHFNKLDESFSYSIEKLDKVDDLFPASDDLSSESAKLVVPCKDKPKPNTRKRIHSC